MATPKKMSTQAKKERLAQQRDQQKCEIIDFVEQHKFECEHLNDYQIRINGILDVYPTNKKYCVLKTKRWGMYDRVEELLRHLQ